MMSFQRSRQRIRQKRQSAMSENPDIPAVALSQDGKPLPAEPRPMSAEWFAAVTANNAVNLQQAQANAALKAKELREAEDAVQRIVGVIDTLKALQALAVQSTP